MRGHDSSLHQPRCQLVVAGIRCLAVLQQTVALGAVLLRPTRWLRRICAHAVAASAACSSTVQARPSSVPWRPGGPVNASLRLAAAGHALGLHTWLWIYALATRSASMSQHLKIAEPEAPAQTLQELWRACVSTALPAAAVQAPGCGSILTPGLCVCSAQVLAGRRVQHQSGSPARWGGYCLASLSDELQWCV